jgi:GxxExxY protein
MRGLAAHKALMLTRRFTVTTGKLLYEEITYVIIGAAMEVHRILGSGFVEAVYEAALAMELHARGIAFERQALLQVRYKGAVIGEYRADFIIGGKVILELKAIKKLTEIEEAQLMNYLKATGIEVGLLLNFGAKSLEHVRRALSPRQA